MITPRDPLAALALALQHQYKPTFKQRLGAKRIALNKQVLHRNSERKMAQSLK